MSVKNIFTVLSMRATANNLLSGLTLAYKIFSSNSKDLKCNKDSVFLFEFGNVINSNFQNFTV